MVRFRFFSDPGGNYWSVQQPTDQKSTETVDTIDNTSLPGGGPHFAADPGVRSNRRRSVGRLHRFPGTSAQTIARRPSSALAGSRPTRSLRVRQGDT